MIQEITPVAQKTAALFLVMLCGIIARRRHLIDENSTTAMSRLLLYVTQPLLIISSFELEYKPSLIATGLTVLAVSVGVHLASTLLGRLLFFRMADGEQRKIFRYAFIFANCSFLGFPLLDIIFKSGEGIFYGSFWCIMFNFYNWTYGYSLMQSKQNSKINWFKAFVNAGTVSTLIGIIIFSFRIRLPEVISDTLETVGDMTFPLSMIIIGSLLADIDFKRALKDIRLYIFAFLKLFALPLAAILICAALRLSGAVPLMAVIMCSMPSATNTAIFADAFGADKSLAAELVGVCTLFSVITIPAILWIYNILIA